MNRLPQKIAAVLLIGITFALTSGPAAAASFVPKLAGTWEITGTPELGGCGPQEPFTNISSISVGGTLTNSDPNIGTSLGEVHKTGRKRYTVGFFGFISLAPGMALVYEVQGTVKRINPGEFGGKFRTTVTDPMGAIPSCTYEGTIHGTRLVPMPY